MTVKIRKATLKDAEKCADFCKRAFETYMYKNFSHCPDKMIKSDVYGLRMSEIKRLIKDKLGFLYVADDKNKVIGLISGFMESNETGNSGVAFLSMLLVDPLYRKRGIGTKLLKATEEWCKKNKCHEIYTNTHEKFVGALPFYNKRGFKKICIYRNHWWKMDWVRVAKWLK